jgi:hypothetical protein
MENEYVMGFISLGLGYFNDKLRYLLRTSFKILLGLVSNLELSLDNSIPKSYWIIHGKNF